MKNKLLQRSAVGSDGEYQWFLDGKKLNVKNHTSDISVIAAIKEITFCGLTEAKEIWNAWYAWNNLTEEQALPANVYLNLPANVYLNLNHAWTKQKLNDLFAYAKPDRFIDLLFYVDSL